MLCEQGDHSSRETDSADDEQNEAARIVWSKVVQVLVFNGRWLIAVDLTLARADVVTHSPNASVIETLHRVLHSTLWTVSTGLHLSPPILGMFLHTKMSENVSSAGLSLPKLAHNVN